MNPFISTRMRPRGRLLLGITILIAAVSGAATAAQARTQPDGANAPMSFQAWQHTMQQTPVPGKGCFKAKTPQLSWTPIACVKPPNIPMAPKAVPGKARLRTPGPGIVGNGTDYSAQVAAGTTINSATGFFPTVTNVTSETGDIGGAPPAVSDAYTLQLNSQFFTTATCAGHPSCQGWEQFVFLNEGTLGGVVFIQYWLLKWDAACPSGWNAYPLGGHTYCYENSPTSVSTPDEPVTNLGNLNLTGSAVFGGIDTATLTDTSTSTMYSVSNNDSVVGLAPAWRAAEFIVAGPGGGSEAVFNAAAKLDVKMWVHNGTTVAPSCLNEGFTGETNNLGLVAAPALAVGTFPSMETEQDAFDPPVMGCATASGVRDTHLTTFSGLYYDFQATGDFLLAQSGAFSVQTRQTSGAPMWPNAAVNHAVATKMGSDRVAVCAASQTQLAVDGKGTSLADGGVITLASGVKIQRTGNTYLVTDASGNSMQATVYPTYIDLNVGLGTWPNPVRGLLANPGGNVNLLQGSDGTIYQVPLAFQDLYGRYGESWRLAPSASVLSDCGQLSEQGDPSGYFYANNLDQQTRQNAQTVCLQAGLKVTALLDSCTIDVAVLGKGAAVGYANLPAPVLIGNGTK